MSQLNNPFAQVGLNREKSDRFQRLVQVELFGRHAFRFDDQLRIFLTQQADDNRPGFSGVSGPVQFRSGTFRIVGKRSQVAIQMGQRFRLDLAAALAQRFPVVNRVQRQPAPLPKRVGKVPQRAAQLRVG